MATVSKPKSEGALPRDWETWREEMDAITMTARMLDSTKSSEVMALLAHAATITRSVVAKTEESPEFAQQPLWELVRSAVGALQNPYPVRFFVWQLLQLKEGTAIPAPACMPAWPEILPREIGYLAAISPYLEHFHTGDAVSPGIPGSALGNAGIPCDMPLTEWHCLYRAVADYACLLGKILTLSEKRLKAFSPADRAELFRCGVAMTGWNFASMKEEIDTWISVCDCRKPTPLEFRQFSWNVLNGGDAQEQLNGITRLSEVLSRTPGVISQFMADHKLLQYQTDNCLKALCIAAFKQPGCDSMCRFERYEQYLQFKAGRTFFRSAVREMVGPEHSSELGFWQLLYLVTRCGRVEMYDRALFVADRDEQRLLLTDGLVGGGEAEFGLVG